MALSVIQSKSTASSDVAGYERTGMFSDHLSLLITRNFSISRSALNYHLARFDGWAWQEMVGVCDSRNPLVLADVLPHDPSSLSIIREALTSPSLPGYALLSESEEDAVLVPSPARPEGCPKALWFPCRDYKIGEATSDIFPVMTITSGDDVYTQQRGLYHIINQQGTFPRRPTPNVFTTRAADITDTSMMQIVAFKAKRLWVFRPITRDLAEVQLPLHLYNTIVDLGLSYGADI